MKCTFDVYAESKGWVPAPSKHQTVTDWRKTLPANGKWDKNSKRQTSTDAWMKSEKKKSLPAPGYYDSKKYFSNTKKDTSGHKDDKRCSFIEDATWYGNQSPGQKYQQSHDLVQSRSPSTTMHKAINDKFNRLEPIKQRKDSSAPGDYIKEDSHKLVESRSPHCVSDK